MVAVNATLVNGHTFPGGVRMMATDGAATTFTASVVASEPKALETASVTVNVPAAA